MNITRKVCDFPKCEATATESFATFKERRMDGAGSYEDCHNVFDLCPQHQAVFLRQLMGLISNETLNLAAFSHLNIQAREG